MTGYNGWTNYETWCVKLWMDNEEGSYRYWLEKAEEDDVDASDLAEIIQCEHEEALPNLEGFAADLLNTALSEVNWVEIAESLIEDQ